MIAALLPDILVKGADWSHFVAGREEVEAAGGKVVDNSSGAGFFDNEHRAGSAGKKTAGQSGAGRAAVTHPAIRELFQSAAKQPAFQLLLQQLTRGETGPYNISGLVTTAKALYLVLLYQATDHPVLVIVDGSKEAEELLEATQTFFKLLIDDRELPDPQLLPAHDVLPSQKLSPHNEIAEARAVALWRLSTQKVPITVVPVASALYRTESSDFYRQLALTVRVGDELPLEVLLQHLESIGYERREPVEMEGEYSLRGGILDVFPAEAAQPVRIEFFGDEVESVRRFDVETQRSILKLNTVQLLPLVEHPRSRPLFRQLAEAIGEESGDDLLNPGDPFPGWEYLVPLARPRSETVFSLCPNALVVLDEPEAIHSATERLWVRLRNLRELSQNRISVRGRRSRQAFLRARY